MAHLTLQLGTMPLIPFASRRRDTGAAVRTRGLLEAALVPSRRTPDYLMLDPTLLASSVSALGPRRRLSARAPGGAGR